MLVEIQNDENNLQWDKYVASAREDYIRDAGDKDMYCFHKNRKVFCLFYSWKTKAYV